MSFSIEANLLTKAFFGSTKEIGSGIFSRTLPLPTIYTMAGAFFTQLIKQYAISANEIQGMVKNGELQVYGVYLKYEDEYYIPISYQLIDKVDEKLELRLELKGIKEMYEDTLSFILSKFIKPYDMGEKDVLYLLNLDKLKDCKVISFDIKEEERTRIGMRYPERVTEEGILFTTTHKDFELKVKFCIDVVISNKQIKKIDNWIGNLGGEATIANFEINEKTHLVDKVKTDYKEYLSISHIPILLKDNKIISNFGEIEAIIGSIEPISGWELGKDKQKMKRIFASIKPGSLFSVKIKEEKLQVDEWYLNLLKSAIPLSLLK
ncbi:MAG: type III-B CRISPR module-associated Cmr3 family protein [Candidatus Methanomethylicia archaeon]